MLKTFKIREMFENCLQPGFIPVNSFFTNLNLKLQKPTQPFYSFYCILHSTTWENLQKINTKIKQSCVVRLDRKPTLQT